METVGIDCVASSLPAWVQAVGSVVAIFTAIWISWRQSCQAQKLADGQRERDDRERRLLARSLALAINPELWEMKAKLMRAGASEQPIVIDIPPVLVDSVDRLYLLEGAGEEVQQFLALSRQYNRMLSEITGVPHSPQQTEDCIHQLKIAEEILDSALTQITPIHDGTD